MAGNNILFYTLIYQDPTSSTKRINFEVNETDVRFNNFKKLIVDHDPTKTSNVISTSHLESDQRLFNVFNLVPEYKHANSNNLSMNFMKDASSETIKTFDDIKTLFYIKDRINSERTPEGKLLLLKQTAQNLYENSALDTASKKTSTLFWDCCNKAAMFQENTTLLIIEHQLAFSLGAVFYTSVYSLLHEPGMFQYLSNKMYLLYDSKTDPSFYLTQRDKNTNKIIATGTAFLTGTAGIAGTYFGQNCGIYNSSWADGFSFMLKQVKDKVITHATKELVCGVEDVLDLEQDILNKTSKLYRNVPPQTLGYQTFKSFFIVDDDKAIVKYGQAAKKLVNNPNIYEGLKIAEYKKI